MPMVTRCPACATLFRVTPQQLQVRDGQVRCGRCMTVFHGFAALAATPDLTPPEPQQPVAVRDEETAAGQWAAEPLATDDEAPQKPPPPPAAATESPAADAIEAMPADLERATSPALSETAPAVDADRIELPSPELAAGVSPASRHPPAPPYPLFPPAYGAGRTTIPASAISADESFLAQAHAKPRRSSRIWTLAALTAALVLAGQAVYVYRTGLAARYPVLRPALAQACAMLGCSVPLPQQPRLINIEASDLQIVDPARPGLIQLTATLRNHASHDLGYPALDLVLTGTREHTLARRIFLPEEYLERRADLGKGLAASAETTIRLVLDTGGLGAAGFRLDLLPAPAR